MVSPHVVHSVTSSATSLFVSSFVVVSFFGAVGEAGVHACSVHPSHTSLSHWLHAMGVSMSTLNAPQHPHGNEADDIVESEYRTSHDGLGPL